MVWVRKRLADFNAGKTQLVSFDQSNNTGAIDVKTDGPDLEEKSSFKMLGGLSLPNWIGAITFILSISETASNKIGTFIRSMKLLSPEVTLYLYESTIRPSMEYCCHVLTGAPSCYLKLLVKLPKWIL